MAEHAEHFINTLRVLLRDLAGRGDDPELRRARARIDVAAEHEPDALVRGIGAALLSQCVAIYARWGEEFLAAADDLAAFARAEDRPALAVVLDRLRRAWPRLDAAARGEYLDALAALADSYLEYATAGR